MRSLGAFIAAALTNIGGSLSDIPASRKRPRGQRLIHTGKVVNQALHRVRGKLLNVPVKRAVHFDGSKDYRGRLGAKDKARRARALGVA